VQLEHKFSVPASVDTVWQALLDPERVAPCFPGATIKSVEGNEFSGTVKVKLGPVSLLYKGSGEFTETDESARTVVIKASGKDSRGNGTASADVTVSLSGNGESTEGKVVTDLAITGKPAQFGRGMIADVGGKILDSFASCLAEKLGGSGDDAGAEAGGTAETGGAASSSSGSTAASGTASSSSSSTSSSSTSSSTGSSSSGSSGGSGGGSGSGAPTASSASAKPAAAPASGSAAKSAPGTSDPSPRREIKQTTEAEPIDLFEYAGSSVAKRAIPAVAALIAVIVGIIIWRKR
jgi:carbon monoxide dehydrogenase subunit G